MHCCLRRLWIGLLWLSLASCKDFESWNSRFSQSIVIEFKKKMDPYNRYQDEIPLRLISEHIGEEINANHVDILHCFVLGEPQLANDAFKRVETENNRFKLSLQPDKDKVVLKIQIGDYAQEVCIAYEVRGYLHAHKAGGLAMQYAIQRVELKGAQNSPIFVDAKINTTIPLYTSSTQNQHGTNNDKAHITLYY